MVRAWPASRASGRTNPRIRVAGKADGDAAGDIGLNPLYQYLPALAQRGTYDVSEIPARPIAVPGREMPSDLPGNPSRGPRRHGQMGDA